MNIKTKLFLSTLIQALLVVALIIFLVITSHRITQASANEMLATKIVKTITEIRFVTFEYLLHRNERSYKQWLQGQENLNELLHNRKDQPSAQRAMLDAIATSTQDISTIFHRLMSIYSQTPRTSIGAEEELLAERLVAQLLVKQQSQISDAYQLSSLERSNAQLWRQQTDMLTGGVIITMISIAAFNIIFITRTITRNLGRLEHGATKLSQGDLAYRIPSHDFSAEFGKLAATFNSMASSLEQTDKVRSEFIFIASHQLRTPLTSLKWYTEELLFPTERMSEAAKKESIRQIHESNERMIGLVDQLLTASKISFDSLSANLQMVKVRPIIYDVLRDISASRRSKGVIIKKTVASRLPEVWTDPTWLHAILQNLLSNAIKYSSHGQRVSLTVASEHEGLLITVADQGCGIPPAQKGRIFTRLFRADNARQMEGEGSGLGLYIAKAMVDQSGGKIWFDSTEGQGTTFYVWLSTHST